MYITRIEAQGDNPDARRLLSSPYRIHAAVEGAFGNECVRSDETGRILWRLEDAPSGKGAWLYIVSPSVPALGGIIEQLGGSDVASCATKDYSPALNRIEVGQTWQFRLKANPSRKVLVDQGRAPRERVVGTVQGHVTAEQQLSWLVAQSGKHGFRVKRDASGNVQVCVSSRRREEFRRGEATVTIATAVFDGLLEVTNPEEFKRTLGFGIGRAKSFGCGLLTIALPG